MRDSLARVTVLRCPTCIVPDAIYMPVEDKFWPPLFEQIICDCDMLINRKRGLLR